MVVMMLKLMVFVWFMVQICKARQLKVVTIAKEETDGGLGDGYTRFVRSAKLYGLDVEVFGMKEEWIGGDMENEPGDGHKINLLRKHLKKYENDQELILIFTDSYNVIFTEGPTEILKKYDESNATILFSTEDFCWPDRFLTVKYPKRSIKKGQRFMCSESIIGPASKLYEMITMEKVENTDDQLYFTKIYFEKFNMKLDHRSNLFQNLNGNKDHVTLSFDDGKARVHNSRFNTFPSVIHGNSLSKVYLDYLGNYIANSWSFSEGCIECKENTFLLNDKKEEEWPIVLIGLFIPSPTPFVQSYLRHISNLRYPKSKIDIFLHNAESHHESQVNTWMEEFSSQYRSFTHKGPRSFLTEKEGRNMGIAHCKIVQCDYYLSVDADVTLSNRESLKLLIQQNRTFLTPMLSRPEKLWTNFWGDLNADGYYARAPDYLDIVKNIRRGVWNSPFVSNIYLIKSSTIDKMVVNPFYSNARDLEIKFCENNRNRGIFMFVTNLEHFGHLKETETYSTSYKHNDLYQLFDNRLDWEDRYLHPRYKEFLDLNSKPIEPCQDVYWYPLVTTNYTHEMIEELEHFGEWSGGNHEDKRIAGGYENVPTVDIHMNQIGFEDYWLKILGDYVAPMCTRYFPGYYPQSKAIMNFVVKYTPSGQKSLRPHHDASTFTINMAMNKKGVDFEGGGVRFTRYNCSVLDTKEGWALMNPGRLTHQHEGLEVTKGIRYIMVSFIDP